MKSQILYAPPVTDGDHMTLLTEIRALKEYQATVRQECPALAKVIPLIPARKALPHVRRILSVNAEGMDRTLYFKNRDPEALEVWEREHRLRLAARMGGKDQIQKLLKIASVLTAVKQHLN